MQRAMQSATRTNTHERLTSTTPAESIAREGPKEITAPPSRRMPEKMKTPDSIAKPWSHLCSLDP
ncbi:hypothetical protein M407DRAFT_240694 [Tulasnella calospora MUT 4182]|uniref:Uncharacterized protein n=1 Tax=Tulasnella calospora MUT 4182 TaxID=1051891 RepID=A0A0C3ML37_9AGAM|nr:hypothetical protein M407DRAFT_240694 [Tulasnella calospora MUT 4182]